MFEVIPAIDIMDGKCVRLLRGDFKLKKTYYDDPVSVAVMWESFGAKRLHVVDLDGAHGDKPLNVKVVERIVRGVNVPVQFGGGVKSLDVLKRIVDTGIDRVVVGTVAVNDPDTFAAMVDFYPGKIVLGVDAKFGRVAVKGWTEVSELEDVEFALKYERMDIWGYVYTDIMQDGTLSGVNIKSVERFSRSVSKPVIASGGVRSLRDVNNVKALFPDVTGVIVGKALYEGTIEPEEVF